MEATSGLFDIEETIILDIHNQEERPSGSRMEKHIAFGVDDHPRRTHLEASGIHSRGPPAVAELQQPCRSFPSGERRR